MSVRPAMFLTNSIKSFVSNMLMELFEVVEFASHKKRLQNG